ncbi:hypothetical protein GCM10010425_64920 [Streptomyces spororaveus]|uniref:Uncharacterized protein n=1 Tax=Streptomyces spororaveus TaxID=284039 RepID=A0ABQ3T6N4_9ACTN|nr:hypothetical protein Sspor_16220 [Streptomyces spororaveus]
MWRPVRPTRRDVARWERGRAIPRGGVKAPMAYVVAATVPVVLLELTIDDRTVRLIPC